MHTSKLQTLSLNGNRAVRLLCSVSDMFLSLETVVRDFREPLDTASTEPISLHVEDLASLLMVRSVLTSSIVSS